MLYQRGDLGVVCLLLAAGASPAAVANNHFDPLLYAARHGHAGVAKALIEAGAGLHTDLTGKNALVWAAEKGHVAVVDVLIAAHFCDVNARLGDHTVLTLTAMAGRVAPVTALVRAGADVDAVVGDRRGATALLLAAELGHVSIVEALLDDGASVEARDAAGWTALIAGARSGSRAVVQTLVDAGADVQARAQDGHSGATHVIAFGFECECS